MNCTKAPKGWYCTREAGHTGPCAAKQKSNDVFYICSAIVAVVCIICYTIITLVAR